MMANRLHRDMIFPDVWHGDGPGWGYDPKHWLINDLSFARYIDGPVSGSLACGPFSIKRISLSVPEVAA